MNTIHSFTPKPSKRALTSSTFFFCGLFLFLCSLPTEAAVTIYEEYFTGTSTANLNGTTPDTTLGAYGGTAGATWTSGTLIRANGSVAPTYQTSAFLSFEPVANNIYTLTATLENWSTNSGEFIGFGFAQNAATGHTLWHGELGQRLYARATNSAANWAVDATSLNTKSPTTGLMTMTLVLDTTSPNWTASWYHEDMLQGSYTYTTNPDFNYVMLSGYLATPGSGGFGMADFSYFSLTVASIPEPSRALLGFIAVGSCMMRRNRKSTCCTPLKAPGRPDLS